MSIQEQANTEIDIYSVQYPQGQSGGFVRSYTWLMKTKIMYMDNTGEVNKDFKQRQEHQKGLVMSQDPAVWTNLHDCCVINGTQFRQVES